MKKMILKMGIVLSFCLLVSTSFGAGSCIRINPDYSVTTLSKRVSPTSCIDECGTCEVTLGGELGEEEGEN